MERLEAALDKAREKRTTAKSQPVAPEVQETKEVETVTPVAADKWLSLKTLKISGRTARNNRIMTMSPNKNSGAYDMLRSRSMRLMTENKWSRVAVTSPNANCGKTTVSANLAFSFARQLDLKVMVFDMDLRRPALAKILAHKGSKSLHQVLAGKTDPHEQLRRHGDNLAFALNYQAAMNPAEILQSNATKKYLDNMQEYYNPDIMIFDMPPLLSNDDNVGFLKYVDCAMLIGAAESTTVSQVDKCEKELAELTNVLGVVLNKCRYMDEDGSYEYNY